MCFSLYSLRWATEPALVIQYRTEDTRLELSFRKTRQRPVLRTKSCVGRRNFRARAGLRRRLTPMGRSPGLKPRVCLAVPRLPKDEGIICNSLREALIKQALIREACHEGTFAFYRPRMELSHKNFGHWTQMLPESLGISDQTLL
jgi:hypothetical protein